MSTDIKLSKAKISKVIHSGGFLGLSLSKLAIPWMRVALPLAKNILSLLGNLLAGIGIVNLFARSKFVRKSISRNRNCKSWFWLSFFGLLYFVWK